MFKIIIEMIKKMSDKEKIFLSLLILSLFIGLSIFFLKGDKKNVVNVNDNFNSDYDKITLIDDGMEKREYSGNFYGTFLFSLKIFNFICIFLIFISFIILILKSGSLKDLYSADKKTFIFISSCGVVNIISLIFNLLISFNNL